MPLLLAAAAGALDGASFTAFHDVVVSAMTGSFVALGRGLGSVGALAPAAWAALAVATARSRSPVGLHPGDHPRTGPGRWWWPRPGREPWTVTDSSPSGSLTGVAATGRPRRDRGVT
ncbi:DUF1275 family protein [Pseudonocardia sp. McavD-2-B]|uniref:DUF1275 family protein n=1 Tax=Pseudonocardia sp. McavD-2-B TaxID=2954499 RepID=UPI0035ABB8DF